MNDQLDGGGNEGLNKLFLRMISRGWLPFLFAVLGLFAAVLFAIEASQAASYQKEGIVTTGLVVSVVTSLDANGNEYYKGEVVFEDEEGRSHQFSSRVFTPPYMISTLSQPAVELIYLKSAPKASAMLTDFMKTPDFSPVCVALLVALGCALYIWRAPEKRARLK